MATTLHTHASAVTAVTVFLMVAIIGTVWRIGAAYAVHSSPPDSLLHKVGQAAAFQY